MGHSADFKINDRKSSVILSNISLAGIQFSVISRFFVSVIQGENLLIDTTMGVFNMLQTNCLKLISMQNHKFPKKIISLERFAIVLCGLFIATFAIPLLVFIQSIVALFWGIVIVFQLLNGKVLLNADDEL